MNKTELVEAIASSTELTKTDVDKVVTALVEVVIDALAKGDKVSLKGFGNFEVRTRSERTGRNPRSRQISAGCGYHVQRPSGGDTDPQSGKTLPQRQCFLCESGAGNLPGIRSKWGISDACPSD